jgi:hypothetical protein
MKTRELLESPGMKFKWKTSEAPTGRFKSFHKRGWPGADFPNGDAAIRLECPDGYHPADVKIGKHEEISVYIADHSTRERLGAEAAGFEWKKLKARAKTLDEAKKLGMAALEGRPEFWPKELRPKID